jgi:hypothetical protein
LVLPGGGEGRGVLSAPHPAVTLASVSLLVCSGSEAKRHGRYVERRARRLGNARSGRVGCWRLRRGTSWSWWGRSPGGAGPGWGGARARPGPTSQHSVCRSSTISNCKSSGRSCQVRYVQEKGWLLSQLLSEVPAVVPVPAKSRGWGHLIPKMPPASRSPVNPAFTSLVLSSFTTEVNNLVSSARSSNRGHSSPPCRYFCAARKAGLGGRRGRGHDLGEERRPRVQPPGSAPCEACGAS